MIRSTYRRVLPLKARLAIRNLLAREEAAPALDRAAIARHYIRGDGIELGALHLPLPVPEGARVRYVDRMTVEELRAQYPELDSLPLVTPDIITDGETLESIADATRDFVIANQFIEHCQNPLLALVNMFRVLRDGGTLYLSIPDKRYTFDSDRPVTPVEHLFEDYERGAELSRRGHFEEWVRLVDKVGDEAGAAARVEKLMGMDYSIHFHVWTQAEMFETLAAARQRLGLDFDVELFLKQGNECIFVLTKNPPRG